MLTARDSSGKTAEDFARDNNWGHVSHYLHITAPLTQQLLTACSTAKSLIAALAQCHEKLFKTTQNDARTVQHLAESIATNQIHAQQLLQHIKKLIEQGAEVNAQGEQGYTPLHCLIGYCDPERPTQFDEEVRALIDSGKVDLNAVADNGDTALSLAAQYGNSRIFKYLLKKGANPSIGTNPLTAALEHNQFRILRYLLMAPEKQTSNRQAQRAHGADEHEVSEAKKLHLD